MPISESDPRVFFAAERTLLAWLRTGLTVIAIGFVVERFGLFLRLITIEAQTQRDDGFSTWSAALGIAFVIVGSLAIVNASIQHGRFVATLSPADLPRAYSRSTAVVLSLVIAGLGLSLAAFLLFAPR